MVKLHVTTKRLFNPGLRGAESRPERHSSPSLRRGLSVGGIKRPLYGLILVGGQSTRMKKDKASLSYHGKPQVQYVYELLSLFCEKVFISTRKGQSFRRGGFKTLPYILEDAKKFSDIGPLGGILSAMSKYPKASWLVLACDLPFVTEKTLKELISKREEKKIATAYLSRNDGLPEPLCAIYEPSARKNHLKFLQQGIYCPRKILINSKTRLLKLKDKRALDNVNTQEEFKQAIRSLRA